MSDGLTEVMADLVGARLEGLYKQIGTLNAQYQELNERFNQASAQSCVHELKADISSLSECISKKADTIVLEDLGRRTDEIEERLQTMDKAVDAKLEAEAAAFESQQLQIQLQGFNDALQRKAEATVVKELDSKVGAIEERLQAMDSAVSEKLEVLSETTDKLQLLHDSIMETVVSNRHSAELERLRVQLQRLGGTVNPEARSNKATTRRRSMWSRMCGCERRHQPAVGSTLNADTFLHFERQHFAGKRLGLSTGPPQTAAEKPSSDGIQTDLRPQDVLAAVLATEKHCLAPKVDDDAGMVVERLVDEPTLVYCTCCSLESSKVVSCLWVSYDDVSLDAAKHALLCEEERATWDPDSEFKILRKTEGGDDVLPSEVVHNILRAPWPFWDRDLLQQRWQLPLGNGSGDEGSAIVLRSIFDDELVPEHSSRVRAVVSKAAFLLRPANAGRGLQITVCTQIDIGGLVPQWAQNVLTRFAVQRAEAWKEKLREHCLSMASRAG